MGKKKRIIILGAGISGLSAAWTIQKKSPDYECIILEKEKRAGGYLETKNISGVTLEEGAHIFKVSRNQDFLQLIEEIGFSSKIIHSSKKAKKRYLWSQGKMRTVIRSTYKDLFVAFLQEWKKPIVFEEETIWEFAHRRFGKKIAGRVFDPLVLGIYAGDSKQLSINACFPKIKEWERERGSITKTLLKFLFTKKPVSKKGLFSFQAGVASFIRHLESKITSPIFYEQEAKTLERKGDTFYVGTDKGVFEGDEVLLALPAYKAAFLLGSLEQEVSEKLFQIPYQSVTSVNILLEGDVLKRPGFGYLIPSEEKENALGVIFDSSIFPTQDAEFHTKLTLMLRGCDYEEKEIEKIVDRCLTKHLKITKKPKKLFSKKIEKAIPQYILGHEKNIEAIRKMLPQGVYLVGNYLEGVSVNDAIRTSKKTAEKL